MTLSPIPDLVAQSQLCLLLCPSLSITCTWHTHTYTHTYVHTLHRVRKPSPQSCWGDKKWRCVCARESTGVCVGWEGWVEGSVLSSLHSSVLIEGYVKRQTCWCSLQHLLEGCTSISQWRAAHVHWIPLWKLPRCQILLWNFACALGCTPPPWTAHTEMENAK